MKAKSFSDYDEFKPQPDKYLVGAFVFPDKFPSL
mgnify:FL=1